MNNTLRDRVIKALVAAGKPQLASDIRAALNKAKAEGEKSLTKSDVNKVLYGLQREGLTSYTGDPAVEPPEWSVSESCPVTGDPAADFAQESGVDAPQEGSPESELESARVGTAA